jgi:Uma2 family endonuclease
VFEILSPSNTRAEMARKFEFYQTYGVEEYYLYDPDSGVLEGGVLEGWLRQGDRLVKVRDMQGWCSPRLGIRFERVQGELVIYRPDGQRFLSSVELAERAELAEQRAERLAAYLRAQGLDPDNLPEV